MRWRRAGERMDVEIAKLGTFGSINISITPRTSSVNYNVPKIRPEHALLHDPQ
jgi:hypothetical protein